MHEALHVGYHCVRALPADLGESGAGHGYNLLTPDM